MTIKECIDAVDNLKPNQYTMEEKVMWLSFLDGIIIDEVLKTHEGYDGRYDTFTGYSADRLSEILIVPSPYDRLYTAFLKMKIDEENGETQRYNNSARLYNSYLAEFKKHYNKTHMPLSVTGKAPRKKIEKVTVGLSDAERESILAELKYTATEQISDSLSEANMYDVVTKYAQNNVQMLKGKDGKDGKDGKPFTYADFTEEQLKGLTGPKGDKGDKGDSINITCVAEGEYIHINDSADLPMKGLSVLGKTKQIKSTGKNLIPFPYYDGARKELNGLTFTQNYDGGVTISGTATAKTTYTLMSDYSFVANFIPAGSYTITAGSKLASSNSFMVQAKIDYNNKANYVYFQDQGTPVKTTTIPDGVTDAHITIVNLVVYAGYTAENITIYPMLEKGTTSLKYEPYTNGIPSPSPEYPQPMNSAGEDGSVDIGVSDGDGNNRQILSIDTPNGLPGVPVYPMDSGDPYIGFLHHEDAIDIDGQERICDEVDFTKGVYIQRLGEYTIDIDRVIDVGDSYAAICKAPEFALSPYPGGMWELGGYINDDSSLNDAFDISGIDENEEKVEPFVVLTSFDENIYSQLTKEEFKARYNDSKMLLIRAEPIETPLPEEQINAYKELTMYKPTTNISNDDGAYLRAEYIADTKTYIDNKFAELQTAMLNNI